MRVRPVASRRGIVWWVLGLLLVAMPAPPVAAAIPSLLGTVSVRAGDRVRLPKWEAVLRRVRDDLDAVSHCRREPSRCRDRALARWARLLDRAAAHPLVEQLELVNRFANRLPYVLDRRNWASRDYWASPREFLRRSGDCEDYAIFKYATLRLLGVAAEDLRIVVLHDAARSIDHAVLAVRLEGRILVLDNVEDTIRPDEELPHYLPYYSVNERARWVQVTVGDLAPAGDGPRAGPSPQPVARSRIERALRN